MFLNDSRLYSDYSHYCESFLPPERREGSVLVLYHCDWSGALHRHHELSLRSLLITQSPPFEVWVWVPPEDFNINRDFIRSFAGADCVRFQPYDPHHEIEGTPFEGSPHLLSPSQPAARADGFRLLILCKYGGCYFDLDILFLRDFRPLLGSEFVYQWSACPYGNNAVCNMIRGSRVATALIERGIKLDSCHPRKLLRFDELNGCLGDLSVLPAFCFDPIWIAHDTGVPITPYCNRFDDFFAQDAAITLAEFFPQSYAYHWHNRWDRAIGENTIAGRLYREVQLTWAAKWGK